MLPVLLVAVGDSDNADLTFLPLEIQSRVKGLRPKNTLSKRLAVTCVLPVLLAGVLGFPSSRDELISYLRKLLVRTNSSDTSAMYFTNELTDSVRFLWALKILSYAIDPMPSEVLKKFNLLNLYDIWSYSERKVYSKVRKKKR